MQQRAPTRCNNESNKTMNNKAMMVSNYRKVEQQSKNNKKTLIKTKMHNEHET